MNVFLISLAFGALVSATAVASPMSVEKARALIDEKAFDDLYLAFSAIKPGEHPEGDQAVTILLLDASQRALESGDAPLALGLSDAARRLSPKSVEACVINADALLALDQRAAAEAALDRALELQPKNWDLVYRRADYAQQEGQHTLAATLFRRIPKSHELHAQAKARAERLDTVIREEAGAIEQMKRNESEQKQRQAEAARTAGDPLVAPRSQTALAAPSVPEGMTGRSSRHFHIVYQGGARDFAERADYEQRVLDLFEKAYMEVRSVLGQGTRNPVEVVLYTAEEFRFHFGQMFGGGVLGFYSGKIRMNRADTLDDQFYATVVHEFTHAVVDDIARGASVPTWLNEGLARWVERKVTRDTLLKPQERGELKQLVHRGLLPPTTSLTKSFASLGPLVMAAYAQSSMAIETLSQPNGTRGVVRTLEMLGRGDSFDGAFAEVFGASRLGGLDDEIVKLINR